MKSNAQFIVSTSAARTPYIRLLKMLPMQCTNDEMVR
jgi:hypothetical protein